MHENKRRRKPGAESRTTDVSALNDAVWAADETPEELEAFAEEALKKMGEDRASEHVRALNEKLQLRLKREPSHKRRPQNQQWFYVALFVIVLLALLAWLLIAKLHS